MAAPSGAFQPRERRAAEQEEDWDAVAPKRPRLGAGSKIGGRRLIVVLEGASLGDSQGRLGLGDGELVDR